MDKNLSKAIKILTSEEIALAAMFYFEQVFLFCMLINKNVLEWILLMVCKEHTLLGSTNLFSRNHPKLCFWLIIAGWQMPNTEQLLYQTDKSSHQRCCIKKAVPKTFAIFTGKNLCWSLSLRSIKKRLQHRCFTVTKFLEAPILKNICVRLLLNWL